MLGGLKSTCPLRVNPLLLGTVPPSSQQAQGSLLGMGDLMEHDLKHPTQLSKDSRPTSHPGQNSGFRPRSEGMRNKAQPALRILKINKLSFKATEFRNGDFPGGPLVKILNFQCRVQYLVGELGSHMPYSSAKKNKSLGMISYVAKAN